MSQGSIFRITQGGNFKCNMVAVLHKTQGGSFTCNREWLFYVKLGAAFLRITQG